ncbi:uncharacterized protein LOC106866199 [Brachypodium distachyon]|uniref:uncharacterized protein LOC106866199 n=1 Tax=Brachypodium distachyon TaxID=15368 RepID=UPI0001C715C1|nr:uncharacterized protein LOC106866199 [Brachypodium distachyon]|eukprot:XP_014754500.1 uncharacterized protein LOC106866199 [Brachypodium distachyon]
MENPAAAEAAAAADPETLAAGELVWARTKGRGHWWPARLAAASPAASRAAPVCFFGDHDDDGGSDPRRATRLKRFLDAQDEDADAMARASTARPFLAAVDAAHAAAVALLCRDLTCACASPPPSSEEAAAAPEVVVVVSGVANMAPAEFLAALRDGAALDASTVGLAARARLKSWVRALAQGWGPAGPGRYLRRSVEELVDKIDLDVLAVDDKDDDDAAVEEDEEEEKAVVVERLQETPAQRRRRVTKLMEELDGGEEVADDDQKEDEDNGSGDPGTAGLSSRRERKKSKYLSPPYTNPGGFTIIEKLDDLPKELLLPSAGKDNKKKALLDNVGVREVLLLVCRFGKDVFHKNKFPKAAEGFLALRRSSLHVEGADHGSYVEHKCPAAGTDAKAAADVAGLVSGSCADPKQGKGALKRCRKNDQDGNGGSSIKRKMKKTSLTSPAENVLVKASEDATGLVSHSSADLKQGKSVSKRSRKKDNDENGGSSVKGKKMGKASPMVTPLECPAENVSVKASEGIAGLVSDSCASPKQGTSVVKRGRKKGQEGSVASPIKRKKIEKTSPTATLGCGVVITPAVPIRQVRAEDIRSEVKTGGVAKDIGVGILDQKNKLMTTSPVSAATSGGIKSGEKQDQADCGSAVKTPVNALPSKSAEKHDSGTVEATESGTGMNAQTVIADVPVRTVEATKSATDMNAQPVIADEPVRIVQAEATKPETGIQVDMNVQSGIVDVPVRSVEVSTVLETDASLEATVPEMQKQVEVVTPGTNVMAMSHTLADDGQKGEQPEQKKTACEAIANHFPAKASNGTGPYPPNSTPKRKKKETAQYFAHPAEILLEFTPGVILPSKEELISAFSKFGSLIESETDILKDAFSARVVFGKSAEAEAAYNKREAVGVFGQFGPPFATLKRLTYLPATKLSIPPPRSPAASKPSLLDMKKNLENMISSHGTNPNLLSQMQGLLSQVEKMVAGSSSATSTPP